MKNKKTQYEVKVGRYWVVVSDIGYSHYKGKKRISKLFDEPRHSLELQKRTAPYIRNGKKIGRNDKCPCKSGKKYKKCCG
jgi:preprotein translocase subunit SecA